MFEILLTLQNQASYGLRYGFGAHDMNRADESPACSRQKPGVERQRGLPLFERRR